jgi:hypothetical protein
MLSPTGKPLEKYSTPAKARLMAGAAVTPGKGTPGKAGISTPNRDKLVKITWTVKHDSAEGGSMWVVGNLPSLGTQALTTRICETAFTRLSAASAPCVDTVLRHAP